MDEHIARSSKTNPITVIQHVKADDVTMKQPNFSFCTQYDCDFAQILLPQAESDLGTV